LTVKTHAIREEENIEKLTRFLLDTFTVLVNMYKMIENRAKAEYIEDNYIVKKKIIPQQNLDIIILLKEDDEFTYVLNPLSVPVSEITISRGSEHYKISVSTPNHVAEFVLPPATIFDSLYVITNRELLNFIAENSEDADLRNMVFDLYIVAERVLTSTPTINRVIFERSPDESTEILIIENVGEILRRISVEAYYPSTSDSYIFGINTHIKLGDSKIMFYIPDHQSESFVESLVRLLLFLGAENDIQKADRMIREYKRIIEPAYIFLDAYTRYRAELEDYPNL